MHWIESLLTSFLFTGKPLLSPTFSALGYFPQCLILRSVQPFSWMLELDIPLTPMVEVSSEAGSGRYSSLPSALVTAISSSAPVPMGLWKWDFGWLMVPLMGLEVAWQCTIWAPTSCYFFLLFMCKSSLLLSQNLTFQNAMQGAKNSLFLSWHTASQTTMDLHHSLQVYKYYHYRSQCMQLIYL